MSGSAIEAVGLGKRYVLGTRQESYKTIRESLTRMASSPLRAAANILRGNGKASEFWALNDVSFDVQRGDVVGVIGRNGAGKSTLLKILSRITDPTTGYADVYGRVGSLLEVGTGFHPELTGRENIYLNGAILGMKRSEIERKFDEIVSFAEVEKFVETPVKRYSSGMYLRLAFAVAAHLEPEILLVDEVLAVGDAAFQKKCLRRMEDVAEEGRTVLFVSHNMGAIRSLCNKGLFLEDGTVAQSGDLSACISRYFQSVGAIESNDNTVEETPKEGFGRVSLPGIQGNTVQQHQDLIAATELRIDQETGGFSIFCILEDMYGRQLIHLREESPQLGAKEIRPGTYDVRVTFPPLWLNPGLYALHFKVQLWGHRSSSRHVSDKFPLDVAGASSMADATLHPKVEWSFG